ncbi:DUF6463 family protein [Undibacterium sp. Ren11W]|uniref:DUF6463 family protein n=1 Tax=Undibacterium sp. Ren11W TaxID=3413045 RepID=UPI003BF27577
MPSTLLSSISAWALLALGVAHIAFGVVKFKAPLREALSSGFVGRFSAPELRRTAFWFVLFGIPLTLAGHVAVLAAGNADLALLRIIGAYVFVASLIGVAAFPKSPFPASLGVSVLLLLAGYGF